MLKYILRRLLWLPILLIIVSLVTFALARYGPGDPALLRIGLRPATPETLARIRKELGTDQPFLVQYGKYMYNFFQGDMGESYRFQGQKVNDIIERRMWISAQLSFAALVVSFAVGVPIGLFAANKQGTLIDSWVISIVVVLSSIPALVTAPFLLWIFVVQTHVLPASGWGGIFDQRIIMPLLSMGVPGIAAVARLTRASTLNVLTQDYIRTARAKGLSEGIVQVRHVMKNSMIPIITILGLALGGLVEGSIITESLYGIPGIGRLVTESIGARDYPVILATTLIFAFTFAIANLLADLIYSYLDPRIRYT